MSATNRGGARSEADYYPTPAWCVDRLLEELELPGGLWLEPGAGEGHIIRAVNAWRDDVRWRAIELREACRVPLERELAMVRVGNFLALPPEQCDLVIGNPPFRHAVGFVLKALQCAPLVVMLLRLNFLASAERSELMRERAPSVYVLPDRPSFIGGGDTDSAEYAWFLWRRAPSAIGTLRVLATTPPSERRAAARGPVAPQPELFK